MNASDAVELLPVWSSAHTPALVPAHVPLILSHHRSEGPELTRRIALPAPCELLESSVPIDDQCCQPVFFRARHFVLPPEFKRRRKTAPIATIASNLFAREGSPGRPTTFAGGKGRSHQGYVNTHYKRAPFFVVGSHRTCVANYESERLLPRRDPKAAKEVMPYYELRTKLAMERKSPDEITEGVQAAYARGELPKRDGVSFAYMWSADQNLASGIGHWHPHVMVFAPYYDNSMVGGNTFGAPLPQLSDDAGTPFAVVVIPVDHNLFVKAEAK